MLQPDPMKFFPPGYTPRGPQEEAIRRAHEALTNGKRFVAIEGPTGSGKCLDMEARIALSNGPLYRLSRLKRNIVSSFDPYSAKQVTAKILARQNSGAKPSLTITTESGYELSGSADHGFLVAKEGRLDWEKLGKIRAGMFVAISRKAPKFCTFEPMISPFSYKKKCPGDRTKLYDLPRRINDDLAYLLGLFLGDGGLTRPTITTLTSMDQEILEWTEKYLSRFGLSCLRQKKSGKSDKARDLVIFSSYFAAWLEHLGLGRCDSGSKRIPDRIFEGGTRIRSACLRGLFDTDGTVDRLGRYVSIVTKSRELSLDTQLLLLSLGILSRRKPIWKKYKGKSRQYFLVSVYGVETDKFIKFVGFGIERKRKRLTARTTKINPNIDLVPLSFAPLIRKVFSRFVDVHHSHATPRSTIKRLGQQGAYSILRQRLGLSKITLRKARPPILDYIQGRRNFGWKTLLRNLHAMRECRHLPEYKKIAALCRAEVFFDRVGHIRAGRTIPMGDLQTKSPNCFVANGFIVHNSLVAMTLAKCANSAFLTTPRVLLQTQYTMDFPDVPSLKGRENYSCNYGEKPGATCKTRGTCAEVHPDSPGAKVLTERDLAKYIGPACAYHLAKEEAIASPISICNFHSLYYNRKQMLRMKVGPASSEADQHDHRRDLLLVDESHKFEESVAEMRGIRLSRARLEDDLQIVFADLGTNVADWVAYCSNLYNDLALRTEELQKKIEAAQKQGNDRLANILSSVDDEATRLMQLCKRIRKNHEEDPNNWIIDEERDKEGKLTRIDLKPVIAKKFAKGFLNKMARQYVFLSATILDYEYFCSTAGLDPNDGEFIQMPCLFPEENRLVYKRYVGYLNRSNLPKLMPRLVATIKKILDEHKEERGIIHASSYQICSSVYEAGMRNGFGGRLIYPQSSRGQTQALSELGRSKNGILLSPSMQEGVDLKDDLARFGILCKMPWPSMADPKVKARKQLDPGWYEWSTAIAVVQSCGRTVRHEKDYASTYILDGTFDGLLGSAKFPKWFRRAIRTWED